MTIRSCKLVSCSALLLAVAGGFLPAAGYADSTVIVDAGYLRQDANTPLNSTIGGGALLLLVAAGGNNGTTFTNTLSPGQYVAGGDTIVSSGYVVGGTTILSQGFGFNTNNGSSGTGGETSNNVIVLSSVYSSVNPGTYLELRWFPNITLSQFTAGATPTANSVFGAYNPVNDIPTQSLAPDGGNNWVLPGDGSTVTLNFFTSDNQNGSQPVAEGFADYTVVPEPSAYVSATVLMGLMGLWAWARFAKASRVTNQQSSSQVG